MQPCAFKKRHKKIKIIRSYTIPILLIIALLTPLCFCGCSAKAPEHNITADDLDSRDKKTFEDFRYATIGVQTGTAHEVFAKEFYPEAQIENYTSLADLINSLDTGKIDGFLRNDILLAVAKRDLAWIEGVDGSLVEHQEGFAFPKNQKGEALKAQMDAFLSEMKTQGMLDELQELWMGKTEPNKDISLERLTGENGSVKLVISAEQKPFSYMKDGKLVGYDIDLARRFCEKYGYKLEIEDVSFSSMIPGIVSGKYDMAGGGIMKTEERAQSVLFSFPSCEGGVTMVYKAHAQGGDFFEALSTSFEKTFIREERWKLVAQGICITLLITVLSAALGTALGFGLYMLKRTGSKVIKVIATGYTRLVAGTPIVVLLMILFYVVFASSDLNGIWVAVIGFALTTGAFVYQTLIVSVESISLGQTEAAYSLGYTKNRAFFKIVLPQAMRQFMPAYQGEIVSLVKATAVVGYIAVQDLTKMSDIIRSNTYEAFFPLIATAVLYFFLTWGLSALVGRIKLHFEPKKRKAEKIMRGIDL